MIDCSRCRGAGCEDLSCKSYKINWIVECWWQMDTVVGQSAVIHTCKTYLKDNTHTLLVNLVLFLFYVSFSRIYQRWTNIVNVEYIHSHNIQILYTASIAEMYNYQVNVYTTGSFIFGNPAVCTFLQICTIKLIFWFKKKNKLSRKTLRKNSVI